MGGLHGYLPQFCYSAESIDDCIDIANNIHDDLFQYQIKDLRKYQYTELNLRKQGNEYIEITQCDCDKPEQHNNL